MNGSFFADEKPSRDLRQAVERLNPHNPFGTNGYFEAVQRSGRDGWVFGLKDQDQLSIGCFAYHSAGRLNRRLEITSAPDVTPDFWRRALDYSKQRGVTNFEICSFGSEPLTLPALEGEIDRVNRQEFVRDLTNDLSS